MKVKIFNSYDEGYLEREINKWLEENEITPDTILHIKQTESQYSNRETSFTISIFYKEV